MDQKSRLGLAKVVVDHPVSVVGFEESDHFHGEVGNSSSHSCPVVALLAMQRVCVDLEDRFSVEVVEACCRTVGSGEIGC